MDVEELLVGLDPDQRRAVLADGGPLCIVAPAGSGKTRVLTTRVARRILDGSADAGHVLVLTFTRRAAGELIRRLRVLGPRTTVTAGTFHGIAYRLARQRWNDIGRRPPELAADRRRLVRDLLSEHRPARPDTVREVTTEIDWARTHRVPPSGYAATAAGSDRRTALPVDAIAEHYAAYEALKRRRRVIDFDDLLAQCISDVERDPGYAAAVRWRFRHLFVDEFQDVDPLQHALLEAWRGGRDDLCVVGDPRQAIYGWTGADGRWLDDFAELHPGSTIIHLGRSHRSSPQIVALGQAVLTGDGKGGPEPTRPDGPAPQVHHFADAASEAAALPALLRQARPPGGRWGAIAVLARTNAQLDVAAEALGRASIPHHRRAGSWDAVVGELLAQLRSVTGPGSLRAWLDERSTSTEGIADGEAPSAAALPAALREAVEDLLVQEPGASGPDLRMWLTAGGRGDGPLGRTGRDDAVTLTTFHAAKGLEWPTVVIIGAVPGLVPHASARSAAAVEEERRLFHVAVTRAERQLLLTWFGDRRTPWLASLDDASPSAPAAPPPAAEAPTRPPVDPALGALRDWRRQAARAARIDESAVVDDRTLAAIASASPPTVDALASVPGFGPLMARRHGERIMAALATVDPLAPSPAEPAPAPPPHPAGDRRSGRRP